MARFMSKPCLLEAFIGILNLLLCLVIWVDGGDEKWPSTKRNKG